MGARRRYIKRAGTEVVAVRLDLDTDGLHYRKWGDVQTGKPGDWIVNDNGDVYTVDAGSFSRTYTPVGKGLYRKTAPVWAEVAASAGAIRTKEGVTHYDAGSYLVFNDAEGIDGWAVSASAFESMYEPLE